MFTKNQPKGKYDRIHVLQRDVDLAAPGVLHDLITNPPEGSMKATITPDLAQKMLDYNTRNRPKKGGRLAQYTREMKAGNWHYTKVPIIFSESGRVLDGQHRLVASINSGATFENEVTFGAPDDSFAYIDVGAPRTAADIFSIYGEKNCAALASMARIIWKYDKAERATLSGGIKLMHAQLYEYFQTLERIEDSLSTFHRFHKSRLMQPSMAGALHYICARKNRAQADEFFQTINDGGSGSAPAAELHRRLIRNATSGEKLHLDSIAGLVLEGWNRTRRGLSARGMKFKGGKLPAVQ